MISRDLAIENRQLRDRIEDLEFQLSELTRALVALPFGDLPLTGFERCMAGLLVRFEIVTQQQFDATIAAWRGVGPVSTEAIKVHVHRLRAKLQPSGIKIKNHYGIGYSCSPADRKRLAALRASSEAVS